MPRRLLLLLAAILLGGAGPAEDALKDALDVVEDRPRFEALARLTDTMGDAIVSMPAEAGGEVGLEVPLSRVVETLLAKNRGVFGPWIEARWRGGAEALVPRWRAGDEAAGEVLAERYALLDEGALALRLLAERDLEAGRIARALHRLRRLVDVRPERRPELLPRIEALLQARSPVRPSDTPPRVPDDVVVLWRRDLRQPRGSPALPRAGLAADGDDVILHDDGVVRRIESRTGRVLWQFPAPGKDRLEENVLAPYSDFDLPLRDVTVAGDLVLVVMGFPGGTGAWREQKRAVRLSALPREARMRLVALDRRDGTLRWATGRATDEHPVLGDPRCGASSPPRVVGRDIYQLFALRQGIVLSYLARLDLETGTPYWVAPLGAGESGRASKGQPGKRRRFARDATLALPWGARPALAHEELLVQPHAGYVAGVDPRSGRVRWRRRTPPYDAHSTSVLNGFSARNEPLAFQGVWWLAPLDTPRALHLEIGTGRARDGASTRARHVLDVGVVAYGVGRPRLEGGRLLDASDIPEDVPLDGDVHRAGAVHLVVDHQEVVAVGSAAEARAYAALRPDRPAAAALLARLEGEPTAMDEALLRAGRTRDPAVIEAALAQADAMPRVPDPLRRLDVLLTLPPEAVREAVRALLKRIGQHADSKTGLSRLDRWIETGDAAWGRPLRRNLTGRTVGDAERLALEGRLERARQAGRPGPIAAAAADLRLVARKGDEARRLAVEEADHLAEAGELERAEELLRHVGRRPAGRTAWRPALPGPPRPLDLWTEDPKPESDDEIRSIVVPHLVGPGALGPRGRIVVFRGVDVEVWNLEDGKRRARLASDGAGWFGGSLQGVAPWLPEGGVLVTSLVPQEPAEEAGFRVGDWIVRWDGAPLPGEAAFMAEVARSIPGRAVELEVRRLGRTQTVSFVPGRRPIAQGATVDRNEIYGDAAGRLLIPDRVGLSWLDPRSLERVRLWTWDGPSGVVDRVRVLHGRAVVAIRRMGTGDLVVQVDLEHGTPLWQAEVGGRIRSLRATGSCVVVETEAPAAFYLLDAATGRERLTRRILAPPGDPYRRVRTPRPAVVATCGWVWYVDANGDQLHAINSTTGEEVWSERVVTLDEALPLAASGGLVAYVDLRELRVLEIEGLTGRPKRRATWERDVAINQDVRVWLSAEHVYLLQHGQRRRSARVRAIRVHAKRRSLQLITVAAPQDGALRWPLGFDHYVDAVRLSPRGLLVVGSSSSSGTPKARAVAWVGARGSRGQWTERAPGGVLQVLRHPPGRYGRYAHWPTDRGLTLVPLVGAAATGPR